MAIRFPASRPAHRPGRELRRLLCTQVWDRRPRPSRVDECTTRRFRTALIPETTDDDANEPTPSPAPRPLRAATHLAPVLARMQKASCLPLRQLGRRAQVSASYLSRVLSGEALPTWERTEKIALALGADTEAVRKVWDDEHQRRALTPERPRPPSRPETAQPRPPSPTLTNPPSSTAYATSTSGEAPHCPTPSP
ncbi:helix-turn-helix domain-containing protein [Streptomyces sp. NPDC050400]|uniref:helix-turn-helix domain-containing protein n=1 Tax=Streptomyces sp. NPDC050400 TaxID=3365610 RepID=UPI0037B7DBD9